MKRILSVLLVVLLLASAFPVSAVAEQSVPEQIDSQSQISENIDNGQDIDTEDVIVETTASEEQEKIINEETINKETIDEETIETQEIPATEQSKDTREKGDIAVTGATNTKIDRVQVSPFNVSYGGKIKVTSGLATSTGTGINDKTVYLSTSLTVTDDTKLGEAITKTVDSVKGRFTIEVTITQEKFPTPGSNTLYLVFMGDDKYRSCSGPASIKINEIPVDFPTAEEGLVYNGEDQTGVKEGTGYTLADNTAKEAGEYIAVATLVKGYVWSDGTTEDKEILWSIATAHAIVKANDKTKKYGEDDPALDATVTGTFGEDTLTYTVTRQEGEEIGTYDIIASGGAVQGNYDVEYVNGTFEIIHAHKLVKVEGVAPTTEKAGYKSYYKCDCGMFFEDEKGQKVIDDIEKWKAEGGNGYIPKLPSQKDSKKNDSGQEASNSKAVQTGSNNGSVVLLVLVFSVCLAVILINKKKKRVK